MGFYSELEKVLFCGEIELKFAKFKEFYENFLQNKMEFEPNFIPKNLTTPSYAKFCQICDMRDMKKPKNVDKIGFLLHSIAHIEYSAIDIALDACYHFGALPCRYYADWLEVADDEIRHFRLIENLLHARGFKYGDFIVHDGLFVALIKTQNSLVDRMAVLPRFMEANGLDANDFMIQKNAKNPDFKEILPVLGVILDEEISHVKKGDIWFKFACEKAEISPDEYTNIVLKHYPNSFKTKRNLNIDARIKAGFSKNEIGYIFNLQKL